MAEAYFPYWGKAQPAGDGPGWHLLAYHGLDVAAVGAEMLDRDGSLLRRVAAASSFTPESLRRNVPFLLALHDLGKFSEPFQDQQPEIVTALRGARTPRQAPFQHATLGYLLARAWGSRRPAPGEERLLEELVPVVGPSGGLTRRELDYVLQPLLASVLGHHGVPPEDRQLTLDVFAPGAPSRADAAAFARAAHTLLAPGPLATTAEVEPLAQAARLSSWWLAGFAILCDWLGSGPEFTYEAKPRPLAEYWEMARERAARAVRASGVLPTPARAFGGIAGLFPAIAATPTPLQQAAQEVELGDGPRLFVLEDLTGSGKTEAALILVQRLMAAGRADGFFFGLPTMATANAMDARLEPLVERLFDGKASYLLSHSGPRKTGDGLLPLGDAHPDDGYGAAESTTASRTAATWLADSRKKALLASAGVGTVDQALLAALQTRHAALRLFGLQRRVLVVDEVHACDSYMLRILCELLTAHAALGGSAILLSATLPLAQRARLTAAFARGLGSRSTPPRAMEYPLLTAAGAGQPLERPVRPREGAPRTVGVGWLASVDETVKQVVEEARDGRCVCWVRNSVADATEAFDALAALLPPEQVTLFHARFALCDRRRTEQEVTRRFGKRDVPATARAGRVVVATQVVEQSLDIDFDAMVTDLCPVDLIIQRAGRLQRHPELHPGRPPPRLMVLAPAWSDEPPGDWLGGVFRRTAAVYPDPGVLWRTARELHEREKLELPEDARALVEAVHGDSVVPASLERKAAAAEGQNLAKDSVAGNAVISLPLGYLRQGVDWSSEAYTPTRLGEPSTTVRLARIDASGPRPWAAGAGRTAWQLSQLSVARRIISGHHPDDEATCRALEADQPFVGEGICTIPLRDAGDGRWVGRAVATRTRGDAERPMSVDVTYSATRGLLVTGGA